MKGTRAAMSEKLTTFAWKHSKGDQLTLLVLTLCTFPLIWASLELPKVIINDAIDGAGFPREYFGFEFEQVAYLMLLCGLYLLTIACNNGLKFFVNLRRGITGERMLRRARFELFQRVMARPLARLRSTSTGELVQIISAELAPIGDFIGAIVSTPILQGGSFLVYLSFIMVQNPLIGAAALALYPVQAWLIPKLQAKVVAMIRVRLANIRAMAREINDSIEGADDIRSLRTRRWHMAVVSRQLYDNYVIRRRIFILKFLIKFVNNVANHLTPFFIFMIGGYFVIEGRLDIGALTAVLIAYKDLANPWKELLRFYQDFSDMSARWDNVQEQFAEDDPAGPLPVKAPVGDHAAQLKDADVDGVFHPVSCHAPRGQVTAVVAEDSGQRAGLIESLAGMRELPEGKWSGSRPLLYRSAVLVRADARAYAGSMRRNLLLGLMHRPVEEATDPEADARRAEARRTGAPDDDMNDEWIDAQEAGYDSLDAVEARMLSLASKLGIEDDIYALGLDSRTAGHAGLGWDGLRNAVLELRQRIAESEELGEMREDFIDVWAEDSYVPNANLAENLFFARPADPEFGWDQLATDRDVQRALDQAGAKIPLIEIGVDLCESLISLFEGVAGDSDLVKRYGLFAKSEIPHIELIVRKAKARGVRKLSRGDQGRMLQIAFEYSSSRFRLKVVRTDDRKERLLEARRRLRRFAENDPRLERFEFDRWIESFTLAENLFFGPVKAERRGSWASFKSRIDTLVLETGLRKAVLRAGLEREVGDDGVSLNAQQRRRIALARALMKQPGALALEGIADGESSADRGMRRLLAAELAGQSEDVGGPGALIYAAATPEAAQGADHVIWVSPEDGRVKEGEYDAFSQVDWNESRGR
ncbi:ABC transporter transmembrane domain-containing protein [Rhodovulum sp. DZ06]|uniref:ABC transporter transmembrane domain-containing protein n=1 Tax=Rhodovulum sp. DZ06 TaxID=3425126 RepID=UPI003D34BDF9